MNGILLHVKRALLLFTLSLSWIALQGQGDLLMHDHATNHSVYSFIENKGQWEPQVEFQAEIPGGRLYFEQNRLVYNFYDADNLHDRLLHRDDFSKPFKLKCHTLIVEFEGANPDVLISAENAITEYRNYYLGNDPSKWAQNCQMFQEITYHDLYPGIDLVFHGDDDQIKYDLLVRPGADPSRIRFKYLGADGLRINNDRLITKTSVNQLIDEAPISFQEENGEKLEVRTQFDLKGERLSFSFPEGYNSNLPLTIDPTLIFSTYTGSTADNWGFTATYDDAGFFYAGGIVFGIGYNTQSGSYDLSFNGGTHDMAISKYTPNGTAKVFSTYVGGSMDEQPHSLVTNKRRELLVLGTTNSSNFPSINGYDLSHNGANDIVVLRFNLGGSALASATFLGGTADDGVNIGPGGSASSLRRNYGDQSRGEIIVDDSLNVYIASCTKSSNFPTLNPIQSALGGMQDGCVIKLDSNLNNLVYSTYLGGTNDDACFGIALNSSYEVYVAGGTVSNNFPVTTGVLHNANQGGIDGFIARINQAGSSLSQSTYIGTTSTDVVYFVQTDRDDDPYILGQTSGNYPITSGVYNNPNSGQFITKLTKTLNGRVYSTRFGSGSGVPDISPTAFLVDVCEYVYVSGWGGWPNFSGGTNNMPTTNDALDSITDGSDLYFFVVQKDASVLEYASYMGGQTTNEHVDGGTSRFDKQATIYQAVCAGCGGSSAFPTTSGVVSTTNQSSNCNLAAVKIQFPLPGIIADFNIAPANTGCAGSTFTFNNTSIGGTSFTWDFGNGASGSSFNGSAVYNTAGTYTIRLIAYDPNSCNIRDTAYRSISIFPSPNINVSNDTIKCGTDSVQLSASGGGSYVWSPSNGLSGTTGPNPWANPTSNQTYKVVVTNSFGCVDSATVDVSVFPNGPTALAGPDTLICPGDSLQLYGGGTGPGGSPVTYWWSPSNMVTNPSSTNPGAAPPNSMEFIFLVTDTNGCVERDTATVAISNISAIAGPDLDICIGDTVNLQGSGGPNLIWTPSQGLGQPSSGNSSAYPTGTTVYKLTATDAIGCVQEDSMVVTVNSLPDIIASPDDSICLNEQASLSAGGGSFYYWLPAGQTGTNINVSPTSSTMYIVEGTDQNGCSGTDSVFITVLPLPTPDAGPDIVICEDSIAALAASGGVAYSWSPTLGLSNPGNGNTNANPSSTTTYTVTVTGANGCEDSDDVTVIVQPTPVLVVSPDAMICKGQGPASFTATGAPSLFWSNGDTSSTISVNPDSTTIYTVVGYQNGCPSKPYDVTLTVIDSFPIADFIANPDSDWIPLDVNFTNTSQGGVTYQWNLGNGVTSNDFHTQYVYTDSGRFNVQLIVTNEYGCRDTANKTIIVLGGFNMFIPTAFTPNNDGLNDFFSIPHIGVETFNILIFDRWGALIYESGNPAFQWDGKYHDKDCQEGVYTWVVKATSFLGDNIKKAGTVTLLR